MPPIDEMDQLINIESKKFEDESQKRAQSISSISGTLVKNQEKINRNIAEIKKSIASIAKEQGTKARELTVREKGRPGGVKEIDRSMNIILKKLGYTIDQFGKASIKIAAQTAMATKDTLKQYTAAISEDISVNKQSLVAMALSQSTPIFGYFAAKFMETNVFKTAKEKIKNIFLSIFTSIGLQVRQLFSRGKEKLTEFKEARRIKTVKQPKEEIPKLQSGGYVTRSGAAIIHGAEVVAPLNKLEFTMKKAFIPTTSLLSKLIKQIGTFLLFQKIGMAWRAWKWFRASKYNKYLSKEKDPMKKLAADFSTYFSMSLERWDQAIGKAKSKVNKVVEFIKEKKENLFRRATLAYYRLTKTSRKHQDKSLTKIKNATQGTEHRLGLMASMGRKMFGNFPTWILMGVGLLKTALSKIFAPIANIFSSLKTAAMARIFGKSAGMGTGTIVRGGRGAKKGRRAGKSAGRTLGRGIGLIGGALAAFDMAQDYSTGAEQAGAWHGIEEGKELSKSQKVTAGLGAALGGTDGGGAVSGALKGAGLGMAIGSIVPGIGTAIGGAVGAIAGGILGAVGGKNIATGLQFVWDKVQPLIEGVTEIIMYPINILIKLKDRFMSWWENPEKTLFDKVKDVGGSILNLLSWPSRMLYGMGAGIIRFILGKIPDSIKRFIPDFILRGMESTANLFESASNTKAKTDYRSKIGAKAPPKTMTGTAVKAAGATGTSGAASISATKAAGAKNIPSKTTESPSSVINKTTEAVSGAASAAKSYTEKNIAPVIASIGSSVAAGISPMADQVSDAISSAGAIAKTTAKEMTQNSTGVTIGAIPSAVKSFTGNIIAAPKKIKDRFLAVKSYIIDAAKKTGVPADLMTQMAGIESSFDPNIKAPTSSAQGLYQFIDETWNTMLRKYGGKYNLSISTPKTDPAANALMGGEFLRENTNFIKKVKQGQPITGTDLYLAHFLGGGGGSRFIKDMLNNPAGPAYVGREKQARSNSTIFFDKAGNPRSFTDIYNMFTERLSRFSLAALGGEGIFTKTPSFTSPLTTPETAPEVAPTKSLASRAGAAISKVGSAVFSAFKGALGLPAESALVTSEFGPRNTGLKGASTWHKGIDLRAAMGAPIYAMDSGTVTSINNKWGKITLKHPNGFTSEYAHLSSFDVSPGDIVQKGQRIGAAGKTGPIPGMAPHLHHSIKDSSGTPINPRNVYAAAGINLRSKSGNEIMNKEMGEPYNIKDSIMSPDVDKSNIINNQTMGQLLRTNGMRQILDEFKETTEGFLKETQKHSSAIISNVSNAYSTNSRTTIQGITNAINKANSPTSNALREVLNGNL